MRRHGRTDANQAEIIKTLRAVGCTVAVTSAVGNGFPDLVVGFKGASYLLEVKDGSLSPSRRALTDAEQAFKDTWRGHYAVVNDKFEALRAVGIPALASVRMPTA